MRVLTVVANLEKGGVQRTAQNFAEAFNALGHDSRVLALEGGIRRDFLENNLISVDVGLDGDTLEALAAWKPDAIHLHAHHLDPETVTHIKSALGDPVVVELNVFSVPSAWSAMVDVSHQLSTWCLWLYRERGQRRQGAPAVVIPNPISIDAFGPAAPGDIDALRARLKLPSDALVLGRIGQAHLSKWSTNLVSIFEEVASDPRVHLLLVNAPDEVITAARSCSARDRVRVIHRIDGDDELSTAYSLMDLFVHIAEGGESFGIVLLEAQMCETPVVTWSTPWADNSQLEVVGHGVGGFVATHRKGMIDAVAKLLDSPELRANMGAAGRQRAHAFDRNAIAKQIIELIERPQADERTTGQLTADVLDIYSSTIDPPNWFERRILTSRWPKARLLLKYSSRFKPWSHLVTRPIALALRHLRR